MFPKLISLGSFEISTYGALVAIAFLAALQVAVRLGKRRGLNPDKLTSLAVYCALTGLAGAKLAMYLFDWRSFAANPAEIVSVSSLRAAGVFQGGLIVATLFAFWYMRKHGLPALITADAFAPAIALGHAIGRLGCFSVGCCRGVVCDRPWAVTFHNHEANEMTGVPLGVPLHPTQLYETGLELLIFAWLWRRHGRQHRPGAILGEYLILSSMGRFLVEFYRYHEQELPFGGPWSLTQWIALGLVGAGAWLVLWTRRGEGDLRTTGQRTGVLRG